MISTSIPYACRYQMSTDLEIKLQTRLDEIMEDYEQSLACQRKYLQHVTDLEAQLSEAQIAQAMANKKYEKAPSYLQYLICLRCWFCSCMKRVYPD